jgi:hypothetical protein
VATFQLLRHRPNEPQAFLYAFDLLELDGTDMRREPIEVRKATLAIILRKSRPGVPLTSTWSTLTAWPCSSTPAGWASRGLCPSAWARAIVQGAHPTGSSSRTRRLPL